MAKDLKAAKTPELEKVAAAKTSELKKVVAAKTPELKKVAVKNLPSPAAHISQLLKKPEIAKVS